MPACPWLTSPPVALVARSAPLLLVALLRLVLHDEILRESVGRRVALRRDDRLVQLAHHLLELRGADRLAGQLGLRESLVRACLALWLDVDRAALRRHGGGRDRRTQRLADARATPDVDRLALLPVREHRRGDEDRRVRTRDHADQQRERE